ncbi:MAG: hypothetical protein D6788_00870 [Planctomycetota bacterium]|nr:MAG: hypothetical protein D6788_00870 [Planctomycetota bacterium]
MNRPIRADFYEESACFFPGGRATLSARGASKSGGVIGVAFAAVPLPIRERGSTGTCDDPPHDVCDVVPGGCVGRSRIRRHPCRSHVDAERSSAEFSRPPDHALRG